jgi:hypothetical protein
MILLAKVNHIVTHTLLEGLFIIVAVYKPAFVFSVSSLES